MTMEKIVRFGPAESLLGILTEPAAKTPLVAPAVLWLNAGMLHHVGPFGWYVTLARRLAASGFLSFRIDLSGVGESPPRSDGRSTEERVANDVIAAMDFLARKRQVERFVLIGVCSGAIIAHRVMVQDARVVGAVLLDGYAYRTKGYYLRHYGRRLLRLQSWLGTAQRVWRKMFGGPTTAKVVPAYSTAEYFFKDPPQHEVHGDLLRLRERGASCLFFYTGGMAELCFNHRRQFTEMFGDLDTTGGQFQVEYLAEADHLLSGHAHRQLMFERVETWMRRFI